MSELHDKARAYLELASKATKGPWKSERDDSDEQYTIGHRRTKIGMRVVATVQFGFDEPAESEQHANARLIKATPNAAKIIRELLAESEALVKALREVVDDYGWALASARKDRLAAARAALAKHEGVKA